jgi:hypothetical protein
MTQDEKRKHSRIDSINLLNFVHFDENDEEADQGMGRTLNVSEAGILLETHQPIDTSHTVSLTIGFKEDVVDLKGKVIYMKESAEGLYEAGIAFFEMDDCARTILRHYIKAFTEQKSA